MQYYQLSRNAFSDECQRQKFLLRKLKQFRLSASERERKSRHLMNVFSASHLSDEFASTG